MVDPVGLGDHHQVAIVIVVDHRLLHGRPHAVRRLRAICILNGTVRGPSRGGASDDDRRERGPFGQGATHLYIIIGQIEEFCTTIGHKSRVMYANGLLAIRSRFGTTAEHMSL